MRTNNQTTCDSCGEILFGKKGIQWIEKEHISIKGNFSLEIPPEDFVWLSLNRETETHFCANNTCLMAYIRYKREMHEDKNRASRARLAREEVC